MEIGQKDPILVKNDRTDTFFSPIGEVPLLSIRVKNPDSPVKMKKGIII